ncbi:hypothetical protein J2790_001897 [Paenarthrobacter nicotinovorans]|nr:hypothetical protein [Paenarthrobacter nicotinovorans]SCZ56649.1 hypothetical protein SAMN02799638_01918 [Arthrobacter sp. UNCCL28]
MERSCLRNRCTPRRPSCPANAMLTPKARLKLAQLAVRTNTAAAKPYTASWPTAQRWVTRYLEHRPQGIPNHTPAETAQTHRCPAVGQAARPSTDRRAARHSGLDRARPPGPLPDQPAALHRPDHRRTNPPLRTHGPGRNAPRRRDQVREHLRRWRPPLPRQGRRRRELQNLSGAQRQCFRS